MLRNLSWTRLNSKALQISTAMINVYYDSKPKLDVGDKIIPNRSIYFEIHYYDAMNE